MRDVRPRAAARHRAPPPEERSLLDPPLPEVAFVGRSNVGKSSLLNALVGRRIAKISGTPGKTRTLNVFLIPGLGGRQAPVPNPDLTPLYFLDLRHPLSTDDQTMQDALAEEEKQVLAALTKGDKLSSGKRGTRERELREELGLSDDQVVVTSAKTGEGVDDLKEAIAGLIRGTPE